MFLFWGDLGGPRERPHYILMPVLKAAHPMLPDIVVLIFMLTCWR